MKLNSEEQEILAGKRGKALQLALRSLVSYGEAFGADRLVEIKSAHMAGSFGALIYKTYYSMLDLMAGEGLKVKVPTTVNPRALEKIRRLDRIMISKQEFLEDRLAKLGVTPNFSCVCYDKENTPAAGSILAWAESSAVQFANSVLGARTNRNSVAIDLCSAVLGKTPNFGLLLDKNRRGQVLVKVQAKKIDFPALGFLIGKKAVNRVPVVEHLECSRDDLKNMGAAMAAAGAVAMFHIEGVTPEAASMKDVFDGPPKETITISETELASLRSFEKSQPQMVVFGCPQLTRAEVEAIGARFKGKKVKMRTYFCVIPRVKEELRGSEILRDLEEAGVTVTIECPLAAWTVRAIGRKTILTNSGKLYYYLHKSEYGTTEDCLRFSGASV
jgi:hypothetical protein